MFVDDYDIAVARALLQGADVWLNNPRRPQEACGTSGMKAALNGGLNLSILDGWWDECFDGENGWAISSAEHLDDLERRDEVEAGSLFELLERQVVPLFYERWQGPVPRRWVQRVKHSLDHPRARSSPPRGWCATTPSSSTSPPPRRVTCSAPTATPPARELADWKAEVDARLAGRARRSRGARRLARRARHGADGGGDRRPRRRRTRRRGGAAPARTGGSGPGAAAPPRWWCSRPPARPTTAHLRYRGRFTCQQAGRYGITVRIVPTHPTLVNPVELGKVAWA